MEGVGSAVAAVRAKVANVTAWNALDVKVEVGMTEMAAGAVAEAARLNIL